MSPQEGPQTTNPMPPAVVLRQMLYGYRISQAIYVAAKLGIADVLKDGPKGSDELATAVGAHPDALHRLLRVLASVGIFAQVDQHRFTLTPLGALLQTDVPGSLWGTAVLTGEWWWQAYGELLYSVNTGKPAHDHVYGMRNFEYFAQHPETGQLFLAGIAARRGPLSLAVAAAYDFSGVPLLIDVGGGAGDLIAAILKANPAMRGVVFDLPYIIDDARAVVEAEGVAARCDLVAGDFFALVPAGGHAYILRSVIHDWDDAQAVAILKNCHKVRYYGLWSPVHRPLLHQLQLCLAGHVPNPPPTSPTPESPSTASWAPPLRAGQPCPSCAQGLLVVIRSLPRPPRGPP